MANNREKAITDLPKEMFTDAMPQAGISVNQTNGILGTLSNTCKHFHFLFKEDLVKRKLFQAVIDDDCETVKRILGSRLDLLLIDPPKNLLVESKWTWQKFYAEKIAMMAAKRRQINMFELILSYYDNLEQTDEVREAKAQALSAWKVYETKKNAEDQDEIVIPSEYADYAKLLIDVFSKETFPHGGNQYGYGMLSKETETALEALFNKLLPEQAVKLDDYPDVELLLLAVYKAYWNHFNTFKKWEQRDAFCIRVRGLIQSVLMPETAKIFCESLDDVVTAMKKGEKKEISKEAMSHKLKSGEAFYRTSRDSKGGQGFNFYCGVFGRLASGYGLTWPLEYLCQAKTTDLRNLCCSAQNRKQARA